MGQQTLCHFFLIERPHLSSKPTFPPPLSHATPFQNRSSSLFGLITRNLFQNGDTALHIAAAMGRRKLTKILLESGCDKESKNKQGETSLEISRRKNLVDIITILQNPPPLLSQEDRQDQVRRLSYFSISPPNAKSRSLSDTDVAGGCSRASEGGEEERKDVDVEQGEL